MPTVRLPQGPIHYEEEGEGIPLVCVHGYLMGGDLFAGLGERLAGRGFRVIRPTWPLGAHRDAVEGEHDRGPEGVAATVADFLDALELEDVVLLGNDTGGAICQLVVTSRPERVARLVLTNCDAFDNFPPAPFGLLRPIARMGALRPTLASMRLGPVRRSFLGFGLLSHAGVDHLAEQWVQPPLEDRDVLRDLVAFTLGLDATLTQQAARRLPSFDRPVLIAWATDDRLFPMDHARRLAELLPDARLETIADSRAFSMIDQPDRLADAVAAFAAVGSTS